MLSWHSKVSATSPFWILLACGCLNFSPPPQTEMVGGVLILDAPVLPSPIPLSASPKPFFHSASVAEQTHLPPLDS